MKRLIIVVEGQTEEEFVNKTLGPYLMDKGILSVVAIKIRTSKTQKGGLLSYAHYRRDIVNYLKQQQDIILTTFVDFFRLPTNFPSYEECMKLNLVDDKLTCLEQAIAKDIDNQRFIPYIQKHEFEALVFASNDSIEDFIPLLALTTNVAALMAFNNIVADYPNPEDINGRPQFAPSKRLEQLFPSYDKVLHGNLIIEDAGIHNLLKKCPRFNDWINRLIEKCTS